MARQVITAADIRQARQSGKTTLCHAPDAIVTWQARDDAAEAGILLEAGNTSPESGETGRGPATKPYPHPHDVFRATLPAWAQTPWTRFVGPERFEAAPDVALPGAQEPFEARAARGTEPSLSSQLRQIGQVFLGLAEQSAPKEARRGRPASMENLQQQVSGMQSTQVPVQASSFELPFMIRPAVPQTPPKSAETPAHPAQGTCQGAGVSLNTDDLFSEVRRQVLAKLPQGTDSALVDELVRKALTEQGPGCGGSCVRCLKAAAKAENPEPGVPWLERAGGAVRVNSRALAFKSAKGAGNVGMLEALTPKNGETLPSVGYVEWENGAFSWTFSRAEAVIVLEGELRVTSGGRQLAAAPGDVCAFEKGAQVTFEARGRVKYASVAPGRG